MAEPGKEYRWKTGRLTSGTTKELDDCENSYLWNPHVEVYVSWMDEGIAFSLMM